MPSGVSPIILGVGQGKPPLRPHGPKPGGRAFRVVGARKEGWMLGRHLGDVAQSAFNPRENKNKSRALEFCGQNPPTLEQ